MTNSAWSAQEFSTVVAALYDAAVAPEKWVAALEALAQPLQCIGASISVIDVKDVRLVPTISWFAPDHPMVTQHPNWHRVHVERNFGEDAVRFFTMAQAQVNFDPDAPLVISRVMDAASIQAMDVMQEFAKPMGLGDGMSIMLQATPERFITMDVFSGVERGNFNDAAIAAMREVAPHLRRAFAISNLLDQKALETGAYLAVLDGLACGVVIVDADLRILYANPTARQLMRTGDQVIDEGSTLKLRGTRAATALTTLVQAYCEGRPGPVDQLPAIRIGASANDRPDHLAYVMPVAAGLLRSGISAQARAAVFIQSASGPTRASLDGFAETHALSPMETQVLYQLMNGGGAQAAADALGVALSTVRTHLAHLYAKTKTERQAELIALALRFQPPIAKP